jgi:hypothetical protein
MVGNWAGRNLASASPVPQPAEIDATGNANPSDPPHVQRELAFRIGFATKDATKISTAEKNG